MLRVVLTIVLPLLLPTALYLLWVAGAGAILLAIVLLVVTVHFGASQEGVYVPPRWQGDQIVPGHIEPKQGR